MENIVGHTLQQVTSARMRYMFCLPPYQVIVVSVNIPEDLLHIRWRQRGNAVLRGVSLQIAQVHLAGTFLHAKLCASAVEVQHHLCGCWQSWHVGNRS